MTRETILKVIVDRVMVAEPEQWHAESIAAAILDAIDPLIRVDERAKALADVLALPKRGLDGFDNLVIHRDGWLIHEDDVRNLSKENQP